MENTSTPSSLSIIAILSSAILTSCFTLISSMPKIGDDCCIWMQNLMTMSWQMMLVMKMHFGWLLRSIWRDMGDSACVICTLAYLLQSVKLTCHFYFLTCWINFDYYLFWNLYCKWIFRLRRDRIGNVQERRYLPFLVSVSAWGKHILTAREARYVIPCSCNFFKWFNNLIFILCKCNHYKNLFTFLSRFVIISFSILPAYNS